MPKRKRASSAQVPTLDPLSKPIVSPSLSTVSTTEKIKPIRRGLRATTAAASQTNPITNKHIVDTPDAELLELIGEDLKPLPKKRKASQKKGDVLTPPEELPEEKLKSGEREDLLVEKTENSDEEVNEEELEGAMGRPPPVNSADLPLPWKGRLGYACLNTYLRTSNPPVFSSRICRIASIEEHCYPLADPSLPENPTKNRPDKSKPKSARLGQEYVEAIGLANARDIIKMVRWNDRYGIKFMRLSSEMFPFASHERYGYKLAPFASDALAEAGRVIAELGHRVTMHPGQYTQLGSPRENVIDNSIRDLVYHDEMLSLLKLPKQQDRDAVMILHMGGVFGDKAATLDRFRENHARLPQGVKNRLVLENDDVSWSVHDLLPICHELNIPLVLDFHHHNIIFDKSQVREGTLDIMNFYDEIANTWSRKGITQKMHYSEPTPAAITPKQRRKHSPRVMTLPPCGHNMDLMIEAKDKEQAVFELMRTFKLPGFDLINEIIPHVRQDENKVVKAVRKPQNKNKAAANEDGKDNTDVGLETAPIALADEDVGMGGPDRRVYWPPNMEEWLKPAKRAIAAAKKATSRINPKATVEAKKNATVGKRIRKNIPKGTKAAKAADDSSDLASSDAEDDDDGSDFGGSMEVEKEVKPKRRGRPRKTAI